MSLVLLLVAFLTGCLERHPAPTDAGTCVKPCATCGCSHD